MLAFGQYYTICLDVDGTGPTLAVGDAGFKIYTSPVSILSPRALSKTLFGRITFVCSHCNSGNDVTEAYFTTDICDPARAGSQMSVVK